MRSFLEVEEFQALLEAAGYLDSHPARDIGVQVRELKPRVLAHRAGARQLDGSRRGLGAGAGNAKTELGERYGVPATRS